MSNVIHVRFPTLEDRRASHLGPVLRSFATGRRAATDVFWLKENGELLNILETTQTPVPEALLAVYEETYAALPERLAFFPQYYRFLLSIALDLEALGLAGDHAERMCAFVQQQDLVGGETSDIQRLEAQRLLARRERSGLPDSAGAETEARLRSFVSRPDRFALPNKKAAYELTHIVFYLTEYGRKSADLGENVLQSLENVGIWAYLDGNADLLAEVCIALRYLGHNPAVIWEEWIAREMIASNVSYAPNLTTFDRYHCVFMSAWLGAMKGVPAFSALTLPPAAKGSSQGSSATPDGAAMILTPPQASSGALRELSRHLFTLGSTRHKDWTRMAPELAGVLSGEAQERLQKAANGSDGFARFFESFARAVPA